MSDLLLAQGKYVMDRIALDQALSNANAKRKENKRKENKPDITSSSTKHYTYNDDDNEVREVFIDGVKQCSQWQIECAAEEDWINVRLPDSWEYTYGCNSYPKGRFAEFSKQYWIYYNDCLDFLTGGLSKRMQFINTVKKIKELEERIAQLEMGAD